MIFAGRLGTHRELEYRRVRADGQVIHAAPTRGWRRGSTNARCSCRSQPRAGVRHLLTLINEILNLAQIEAGKVEVNVERVALGRLLAECDAMVDPLAAKRDVMMRFPMRCDHHVQPARGQGARRLRGARRAGAHQRARHRAGPRRGAALLMARAHAPSLIVMDNNMPELSGREARERLGADPRTAAIP